MYALGKSPGKFTREGFVCETHIEMYLSYFWSRDRYPADAMPDGGLHSVGLRKRSGGWGHSHDRQQLPYYLG